MQRALWAPAAVLDMHAFYVYAPLFYEYIWIESVVFYGFYVHELFCMNFPRLLVQVLPPRAGPEALGRVGQSAGAAGLPPSSPHLGQAKMLTRVAPGGAPMESASPH